MYSMIDEILVRDQFSSFKLVLSPVVITYCCLLLSVKAKELNWSSRRAQLQKIKNQSKLIASRTNLIIVSVIIFLGR